MKYIKETTGYLIIGIMALSIPLIVYVGYLMFYPFHPLTLETPISRVENPTVREGGILFYFVDYCRVGEYSASVSRTITGLSIIPTPIVNTITKEGCREARVPLIIPTGTPEGEYHLEIVATFQVNPLRTIYVKFQTEQFNVIK